MGKVEIINSQFDKVEWNSKYSGTVRYYGNNLILNSCKFIKLDTGLVYNSENRETAIELKGLTWDNCNVGFSVNKGLTDLRNCTFNENKIGVNLSEIWHEALLVGLKFTNNNMGINVSNSNEGIGQLLMSDCKSENNGIVLSSYQTEVLLKCNHFKKNEMDIMAEKCLLNLSNTEKIKSKSYSFGAGQYFETRIEYSDLSPDEFNDKMEQNKSNLVDFFKSSNLLEKAIIKNFESIIYE
jgi:hypothetical protein